MSNIHLQDLDQRSVAVSLTINRRPSMFAGTGTYFVESEFGPCLRIACIDPAGDFEMVLRNEDWHSTIVPGSASGDADFTIVLESPPGR